MPYAIPARFVIQYDGTNSATLLALLNNPAVGGVTATLVSEVAGVLTLSVYNGEITRNVVFSSGDWLLPGDSPVISAAVFAEQWIVKP